MTKQDYLNLLNQTSKNGDFPAVNGLGTCKYKTETGKKCAVGILFSEPVEENLTSNQLFAKHPELQAYIPEDMTPKDLRQVQKIHDRLSYGKWEHEEFILDLLKLDCFKGMQPNG